MTHRPYKDHLRYKHMVARYSQLPYYKLESAVLAEIAKGKRWRIEAAMDALEKNSDRFMRMDQVGFFVAAGRYGRLTAMHRLVEIYKSKKMPTRSVDSRSHGILEGFDAAALHGHYRVATFLRQYGGAPDFVLSSGYHQRAMTVAIHEGDVKKATYLLGTGARASYHLPEAAQSGNIVLTTLLLDAGADINSRSEGHWTPLHLAARANDTAMIDLLVARGANVSACAKGFLVDLILIDSLVGLDCMIKLGAEVRITELEYAVGNGKLAAAQMVVDAGITPTPELAAGLAVLAAKSAVSVKPPKFG